MNSAGATGIEGQSCPPNHAAGTPWFEAIVAEADEGVIVVQSGGWIVYANAAAEFLLGHGSRELVGEMFGLPLASDRQVTRVNVVSRDEQVRLVELRIEPLTTQQAGSIVLRLRDITAHHQHLTEARDEVRRRDEFLAMLSHELRNPLAAIQNAATLLTFNDLQANMRRDASDVLQRQFKHLNRILDDLLDISRITRGKLVLLHERVEFVQVLRDAVEAVTATVTKRGHSLEIVLPDAPLWIWGDATRMEQVFVNLLTNAAKFTPSPGELKFSAMRVNGEIQIQVCDSGPGIPAELVPRIFDPFVQGAQTIDRSDGGMGIGLMLARTFVQMHGGAIRVEPNDPAPGVTFTVTLPLHEPPQESTSANEGERESTALRIAIIDDNEDGRRMLALLLKADGHQVLEAANGLDGLELLTHQRPDVALVDIGLPGMSGYEIAQRVLQNSLLDWCHLVAVTGYGAPGDTQAVREAGFEHHLVKPVHFPDLQQILLDYRLNRRSQSS